MSLTLHSFLYLLASVSPVYGMVLLGYLLGRNSIIQPVHMLGISRWISILAVPFYMFHLLVFNNPYSINLKLVIADILQKLGALAIGCLWWKFANQGCVEGFINFFMLATLPNTVLIGDALLEPLYGDIVHGNVVTIIFLQALLWYNICIALYEMRNVLIQMEQDVTVQATEHAEGLEPVSVVSANNLLPACAVALQHPVYVDSGHIMQLSGGSTGFEGLSVPGQDSPASESMVSTVSAPASTYPSPLTNLSTELSGSDPDASSLQEGSLGGFRLHFPQGFQPGDSDDVVNSGAAPQIVDMLGNTESSLRPAGSTTDVENVQDYLSEPNIARPELENAGSTPRPGKLSFLGLVLIKVLNLLKYSPLLYASVLGFMFSLMACKYDWTMPAPITSLVNFISFGCVGMVIFTIGIAWANSGGLISCGMKKMAWGMFVRFIVSPALIILASKIVGLQGRNFKVAVLQAVIPQGVISFVFAKQYDVDANQFSTAVVFQLLVFLPIAVVYFYIMEML